MKNTFSALGAIFLINISLAQEYNKTLVINETDLIKNATEISAQNKNKLDCLKRLISKSDKILIAAKTYSVTNKKQIPPSGDIHDYMSVGPYWWPDTSKPDGLPYIRKDGITNPEYYDITDTKELDKLIADVEQLSLAFFYTKKEEYAKFATQLIEIWFINVETKMNPNLNFGQGIKGKNTGRGTGIIETRNLYRLIDSAILLYRSQSFTKKNQTDLKQWFKDYTQWLITSEIGLDEADSKNNHGTFYSFQVINFALYAGLIDVARKEIAVAKTRLESQLAQDGRQPFELERTKSWNYCNMNLYGFVLVAKVAENLNIDLWQYKTNSNVSIQDAIDWMMPFYLKEKTWEYEQIKDPENRDAIKLLLQATKKYKNAIYTDAAKKVDISKYQNELIQLTN